MRALALARPASAAVTEARLVLAEEGAGVVPPRELQADGGTTVVVSALAGTPAALTRRIEHCMSDLGAAAERISEVVYLVGPAVNEAIQQRRLVALETVLRGLPSGQREVVLLLPARPSPELHLSTFDLVGRLLAEFGSRARLRINSREVPASPKQSGIFPAGAFLAAT